MVLATLRRDPRFLRLGQAQDNTVDLVEDALEDICEKDSLSSHQLVTDLARLGVGNSDDNIDVDDIVDSSDSDDDDDYEPMFLACALCERDGGAKLCASCNRGFHAQCYVKYVLEHKQSPAKLAVAQVEPIAKEAFDEESEKAFLERFVKCRSCHVTQQHEWNPSEANAQLRREWGHVCHICLSSEPKEDEWPSHCQMENCPFFFHASCIIEQHGPVTPKSAKAKGRNKLRTRSKYRVSGTDIACCPMHHCHQCGKNKDEGKAILMSCARCCLTAHFRCRQDAFDTVGGDTSLVKCPPRTVCKRHHIEADNVVMSTYGTDRERLDTALEFPRGLSSLVLEAIESVPSLDAFGRALAQRVSMPTSCLLRQDRIMWNEERVPLDKIYFSPFGGGASFPLWHLDSEDIDELCDQHESTYLAHILEKLEFKPLKKLLERFNLASRRRLYRQLESVKHDLRKRDGDARKARRAAQRKARKLREKQLREMRDSASFGESESESDEEGETSEEEFVDIDESPDTFGKYGKLKRLQYKKPLSRPKHMEPDACSCRAADATTTMRSGRISRRVQGTSSRRDTENCCSDKRCFNFALFNECGAECPAGAQCRNKRLSNAEYADVVLIQSSRRGVGVRLQKAVQRGDLIVEYLGECIDAAESKRRMAACIASGASNFYMFKVSANLFIDSTRKGNWSRYLNHACGGGNCHVERWRVGGETRIGIYASEDIEAGEELTYDYQFQTLGEALQPCYCGEECCSGFLGKPPKQEKHFALLDTESDSNSDSDSDGDSNGDSDSDSDSESDNDSDLRRNKRRHIN
ncbi:MAG: hypothetical protein MHM6MM_003785 [Cercozoa sp. M6MM]